MLIHYRILHVVAFFLLINQTGAMFGQTADELLASYSAAMGFDNFLILNKIRMDGTVQQSETEIKFTSFLMPGKAARNELVTEDLKMVVVFDGRTNRGWLSNSITEESEWLTLTELERLQMNRMIDKDEFGGLLQYKQRGDSLSFIGREMVQETETYHLCLTSRKGIKKEYYLMAENFALLKTSSIKSGDDGPYTEDVWFSDYKEVGGIYIPFTEYIMVGGKINTMIRISELDLEADFDENIFAFPK